MPTPDEDMEHEGQGRDDPHADVAAEAVAKGLLCELIEAESKDYNSIRARILEVSSPMAVFDAAISRYRETARTRYLLSAVSLLEEFGASAWPVCIKLARSGNEECELFLNLIANCKNVPENERAEALADLARSTSRDIRLLIFERLAGFGPDNKRTVLEVLADDYDEEVGAEARDYLSSYLD